MKLLRIGHQCYTVEMGAKRYTLSSQRHPGQRRFLRKYVGSWDAYTTWELMEDPDGGLVGCWDSFREARAALLALKETPHD